MIGDLRHRLTLEECLRTADGGGGATETWAPVATLWASLEEMSGREQEKADHGMSQVSLRIRLRYRTDVTTHTRFRKESRVFNIRAVLDKEGRRKWLTCLCEEEGVT